MTSEELLENFKNQQQTIIEEIRKLDAELTSKKETYVKLQGAIEGLELLNSENTSTSEPEVSDDFVAQVLTQ